MSMRVSMIVAVLLCASVAVADTYEFVSGDFIFELAPDARSEGLGLAFTAVAEGPSGLYWNPAAQIQGRTVAVGYHTADQPMNGMTFTALSAAVEVGGVLRLGGWQSKLASDDLSLHTAYDPDEYVIYTQHRIRAAGAALDLGRLFFGNETTVCASVGIDFKRYEAGWNGETIARGDDKDLGVIVGMRHHLGDSDDVHRGWVSWRLGGVLVNTGESAVEFRGAETPAKNDTPHFQQYGRVGAAIEGRHGWTYMLGHRLRWLLTADLQKTKEADGWSDETLTRYGAELTMGLISGRVGRADASGTTMDGTTYGGGLVFASPRTSFGFRGDYASVPVAAVDGVIEAQRLDRYSASVWLNF